MQELFNLDGKVIIITGATGVLGEAFVNAVADMNAKVILIGRNETVGNERTNQLIQRNKEAVFIKADVLNKEDLLRARDIVLQKFGRINGLVNAAGGNVPEGVIKPGDDVFNIDMNGMHKALDLNLFGTMLPVSVFGEALKESGNASIVNISSMAAQTTLTRILGYSIAKAAIDNYIQDGCVWGNSRSRYGETIRVNAIAPGFFITHQNRRLLTNEDGSFTERGAAVIRNTPFKKISVSLM